MQKQRDCAALRAALTTARARLSTRGVAIATAGTSASGGLALADQPTEFDAALWREIDQLERALRESGCR